MRRRKRVKLREATIWFPCWTEVIDKWTYKYIKKNLWRWDPAFDFDDYLQDAYLVFLKICNKYPRVVEPPHFMALYKTALQNSFCDKSREYTRRKSNTLSLTASEYSLAASRMLDLDGVGYLAALLAEAPDEVKLVLQAFNDDEKLEQMRKPQPCGRAEPRENFNMSMRRILGLKKSIDLNKALRELLTT